MVFSIFGCELFTVNGGGMQKWAVRPHTRCSVLALFWNWHGHIFTASDGKREDKNIDHLQLYHLVERPIVVGTHTSVRACYWIESLYGWHAWQRRTSKNNRILIKIDHILHHSSSAFDITCEHIANMWIYSRRTHVIEHKKWPRGGRKKPSTEQQVKTCGQQLILRHHNESHKLTTTLIHHHGRQYNWAIVIRSELGYSTYIPPYMRKMANAKFQMRSSIHFCCICGIEYQLHIHI